MSSKVDRVQIVEEVNTTMNNNRKVDYRYFIDKYGISRATFYNIMKDYNIDLYSYNKIVGIRSAQNEVKQKQNKGFEITKRERFFNTEEKKETINADKFIVKINPEFLGEQENNKKNEVVIEADDSDELINYTHSKNNCLIVSLISKRHDNIDSNIDRYIFRGPVRSDLMFNFDELYNIANEFIKSQVIEEGFTKLKVIVTGLTQCVGAVIRAAIDNNITLVLMHYNNITGKYNDQFICGSCTDNYQSLLDLYASTKRYASIKLIGHNKEYFTDKSKLYTVKIDNLDSKDCTIYITDNIEKMFKKYSEEVQRLIPIKFESYRVMADELTYGVTNAEFKFNNLGTYFNRPKE